MTSNAGDSQGSTENLTETIGAAALRQFLDEQNPVPAEDTTNDEIDEFEDPNPPPPDAASAEKKAFAAEVTDYAVKALAAFEKCTSFQGETFWEEYVRTFRTSSIRALSQEVVIQWSHILRDRGVYLTKRRGISRRRALIIALESEIFPKPSPDDDDDDMVNESDEPVLPPVLVQSEPQKTTPVVLPNPDVNITTLLPAVVRPDLPKLDHPPMTQVVRTPPPAPFPVKFHKLSAEGRSNEGNASMLQCAQPDLPRTQVPPDIPEKSHSRSRIDSLSKSYHGHSKYSGAFTESLDAHLERYETLCQVFELSLDEKARAFPIMLTGAAFTHFSHHYAQKDKTYGQLVDAFRAWYTSEEQRYRLLQVWQRPSLEKEMQNTPEKSEMEVFRKVSDDLVQTQHQLHADYHNDRFLRDQLLICADIPRLRRSLIEKIPGTAQEAMQRIATLLSSEPKSASAHLCNDDNDDEDDGDAYYGFGKRFGGKARKNTKPFRKKGNSLRRKLAQSKGCWVCSKNHRARGHHSPQEIIQAVNRIKAGQPDRSYTAEEVSIMQEAYSAMIDDGDCETDEDSGADDDDEANFSSELLQIQRENQEHLANVAYSHALSLQPTSDQPQSLVFAVRPSSNSRFQGIILDTGANRVSAMSISQYMAYCREFSCSPNINYAENRGLKGIGGRSEAIGTATIPIPLTRLGIIIDVKFRIMRDNCPSLLSLKDMIDSGIEISIQEKLMTIGGKSQKLEFVNDLLRYRWKPEDVPTALYTETELRKMHHSFGHPTTHALKNLLRTANPQECNQDVRTALSRIQKECSTCQKLAPRTRRFKLSVGTGPLKFNHTLAVDVMYIENRPVLHVVDEATHFASAAFLKRMTADETWKTLLRCWNRVYIGAPDAIRVDQGSNFVARQFLDSCRTEDIEVLQAPVESPATMTHVERYHAPLRAAYLKIRDDLGQSESDQDCLQLAVKCVNDTVGPEGLCPTLLVFGTIPRPPRRTPATTQLKRSEAVEKGLIAVKKEIAKRKLSFALKHPSSAAAQKQTEQLNLLPAGSPVRIFRQKSKKWEGPFPFVSVEKGVVVVQLPRGRKIFRSDVVKPVASTGKVMPEFEIDSAARNSNVEADCAMNASLHTCNSPPPATPAAADCSTSRLEHGHPPPPELRNISESLHVATRQLSTTDEVFNILPTDGDLSTADDEQHESASTPNIPIMDLSDGEDVCEILHEIVFDCSEPNDYANATRPATPVKPEFLASRKKELAGLMEHNVFTVVKKSSVPDGTRIFGTRWVENLKKVNGKVIAKSRLVAQNYSDEGAAEICTKSPTISRAGQRIVLCTAAQSQDHRMYTRDITQAYVQSHSKLERPVFLIPPSELELGDDYVLLVVKPLYGVPEAGVHWFQTYQGHHVNRLGMRPTKMDPCLLFHREGATLHAVTVLQVDDNLGHGDKDFLMNEEEQSKIFDSKPRMLLTPGKKFNFNGVDITSKPHKVYTMDQRSKILSITEPTCKEDLISTRAKLQYIASCSRPDLAAPVQLMASYVLEPDEETYKRMRTILRWVKDSSELQIRYLPLHHRSLRLLLFTDASFAVTRAKKSQMGFVLALADNTGRANLIHWGSSVCQRVTRSVMAAELLALVYGFDNAFVIRDALTEILGWEIPIHAFVDSRTVFNVIAKNANTVEKRLQIDAFAIRQSYHRGELRSLAWIPGSTNPADGLTKGPISAKHPLWTLMSTNRVVIEKQGWVEQSSKKVEQSLATTVDDVQPLCDADDLHEAIVSTATEKKSVTEKISECRIA